MPADPVNYEAVLADLISKRDEMNLAIAAIQRILGQPVTEFVPGASGAGNGGGGALDETDITNDSFFNMPIADAIKKYLKMAKRTRRVNDISEALLKGGMQTLSKNFYTSVYAALQREEDQPGGFKRVGKKDWGLVEWYSGNRKGA